jgi:fucose permease
MLISQMNHQNAPFMTFSEYVVSVARKYSTYLVKMFHSEKQISFNSLYTFILLFIINIIIFGTVVYCHLGVEQCNGPLFGTSDPGKKRKLFKKTELVGVFLPVGAVLT